MRPAAPQPDALSRTRERDGVRARALRQSATQAESRIWQHLRNRQLGGWKELDGAQHFEPEGQASDARRTAALQALGFSVLRFDDRQALAETDAVLTAILQWLDAHGPHPDPLPRAGEGVSSRTST